MTNGDRLMMRVSTNISARVSVLCLRKVNAALLPQGDYNLEDALHQSFKAGRIGQTDGSCWEDCSHSSDGPARACSGVLPGTVWPNVAAGRAGPWAPCRPLRGFR
ncbi:hypothetical protein ACFQ69_36620 [Streptomyces sp. NPDC056470]|uniref:hypothetical protein n=1 Tax=Streptomyces sp. NPDC056470 TaxID=3345831 RepID=UPI003676A532